VKGQGFTLLEVLVAFVIGSVALGWFLYFLSEVTQVRFKAQKELQLIDTVLLAINKDLLRPEGLSLEELLEKKEEKLNRQLLNWEASKVWSEKDLTIYKIKLRLQRPGRRSFLIFCFLYSPIIKKEETLHTEEKKALPFRGGPSSPPSSPTLPFLRH